MGTRSRFRQQEQRRKVKKEMSWMTVRQGESRNTSIFVC